MMTGEDYVIIHGPLAGIGPSMYESVPFSEAQPSVACAVSQAKLPASLTTHRGERYPPVAPWHSVRDKGTNVGTPTDRGDDACAVSQTKLPAGLTWPKNYYRSWLISIGCRSSLGRLSTSTSETIPMWQRAQGATLIIPRPCRGTRADAYGPHGTQLQGFRAL